jgi:hypothetical protein
MPERIAALTAYCACLLEEIRWPRSGLPSVRVLSHVPCAPPEQGEASQGTGGIISCLMFDVCDFVLRAQVSILMIN